MRATFSSNLPLPVVVSEPVAPKTEVPEWKDACDAIRNFKCKFGSETTLTTPTAQSITPQASAPTTHIPTVGASNLQHYPCIPPCMNMQPQSAVAAEGNKAMLGDEVKSLLDERVPAMLNLKPESKTFGSKLVSSANPTPTKSDPNNPTIPEGTQKRDFPAIIRTGRLSQPLKLPFRAHCSWTVYCNNCDKAGLDEHFHCNICEEGDYDLCPGCMAKGVVCPGEGHWLIKRFFKDGRVVASTTETLTPKAKPDSQKEMPGAFTEEKKPEEEEEEEAEQPTRTCNCCVNCKYFPILSLITALTFDSLPGRGLCHLHGLQGLRSLPPLSASWGAWSSPSAPF